MQRWKDVLWVVAGLVAAAMCLWFGVTGLRHGAVEVLSRGSGSSRVVYRATQPGRFWAEEGFWFVPGCVNLLVVVACTGSVWRDSPIVRARRKAARARKTAEQVRSVEAGEGPDPPWVHFPDESAAVSEDALTAYFEDVFVPFWEPLGAEARGISAAASAPQRRVAGDGGGVVGPGVGGRRSRGRLSALPSTECRRLC